MIDKDAAHQLRRDSEEMGAILPSDTLLGHQPQVGLVYQSRGRQRVGGPFSTKIGDGTSTQFRVDERHQFVTGAVIPAGPILQQARDLAGLLAPRRHPTRLVIPAASGYVAWLFHDAVNRLLSRYVAARPALGRRSVAILPDSPCQVRTDREPFALDLISSRHGEHERHGIKTQD